MKANNVFVLCIAALSLSSVAQAADPSPPFIPSEYVISQDPPGIVTAQPAPLAAKREGIEKPAAVSGQLYSVVAPIYLGGGPDGGNTSYLRLYNAQHASSTFTVKIVGFKTDNLNDSQSTSIGTAFLTVPATASIQYSINEIFSAAGVSSVACVGTCAPNVYQGVSLYVANTNHVFSAFQHVIYNSNSRFFENMSICGDTSLSDGRYFINSSNIINVHTTTVVGYPAFIMFHNYSAFNTAYKFEIYDSRTGLYKGPYVATALANTTYMIPMSTLQAQVGWAPTATEGHANVIIFNADIATNPNAIYYGYAGQMIYNNALQAYINMSQICNVAH